MRLNLFRYLKFSGFLPNGSYRYIEFEYSNHELRYSINDGTYIRSDIFGLSIYDSGTVNGEDVTTFIETILNSLIVQNDNFSFVPIHECLWWYEIKIGNEIYQNRGRIYNEYVYFLLHILDQFFGPYGKILTGAIKGLNIDYIDNENDIKESYKINFEEDMINYSSSSKTGKIKLNMFCPATILFNIATVTYFSDCFEDNKLEDDFLKENIPTFKFEFSFYRDKKRTFTIIDDDLSEEIEELLSSCSKILSIYLYGKRFLTAGYSVNYLSNKSCVFCNVVFNYKDETINKWYKYDYKNIKKGDKVLIPYGEKNQIFIAKVKEIYSSEFVDNPPGVSLDEVKDIFAIYY